LAQLKRLSSTGASAIGLTIYPGGEHIKADLERAAGIIRKAHDSRSCSCSMGLCERAGPDEKTKFKDKEGEFQGVTQADSLYWTHYAVSIASGLLGRILSRQNTPQR